MEGGTDHGNRVEEWSRGAKDADCEANNVRKGDKGGWW